MCILYERLSKLCEEKGVSGAKMAADCEMSKSSMTELRKGRRDGFSAKNMNKLANYFGVTVGYLLGEEDNEKPILSAAKQAFIDEAMELTDEQVKALTETVRTFKAMWKK